VKECRDGTAVLLARLLTVRLIPPGLHLTLTIYIEYYTPLGSFGKLGPLAVYETSPAPDTSDILLYCPDGFGHALHNQYLADRFAERGWHVIIPDYYEGKNWVYFWLYNETN
jgi:hypothetical protein